MAQLQEHVHVCMCYLECILVCLCGIQLHCLCALPAAIFKALLPLLLLLLLLHLNSACQHAHTMVTLVCVAVLSWLNSNGFVTVCLSLSVCLPLCTLLHCFPCLFVSASSVSSIYVSSYFMVAQLHFYFFRYLPSLAAIDYFYSPTIWYNNQSSSPLIFLKEKFA